MRYRTVKEATEFIKALARVKSVGAREFMGVKLDSVPAWEGASPIVHKLDGAEIEVVYLSYLEATENQKTQAKPAKLAGVKLERISGRLVDVRTCKDGTVQVLFTNGLRDGEGQVAFRGPNIDKGILCYLAISEGLGESVDEIIARVPQELIDKLKANKTKPKKSNTKQENPDQLPLPGPKVVVTVPLSSAAEVLKPRQTPGPDDNRLKLK